MRDLEKRLARLEVREEVGLAEFLEAGSRQAAAEADARRLNPPTLEQLEQELADAVADIERLEASDSRLLRLIGAGKRRAVNAGLGRQIAALRASKESE